MKKLVCLSVLAFVLAATPTFAQVEVIALFGDSLRTDCHSGVDGFAWFYLFHYSASGATGSRFRLPDLEPCLGEPEGPMIATSPFPHSGHPKTGVTFNYGACLTGWIYVGLVAYIDPSGFGFAPCCEQPIVAHPGAVTGEVEALDCLSGTRVAVAVTGIVNGNASCPCSPATGIPDDPVAPSTWGVIKALYSTESEGS